METSTAAVTQSARAAVAAVVLAVAALAVLLLAVAQQSGGTPAPVGTSVSQAAAPPSQDCCGRGYP